MKTSKLITLNFFLCYITLSYGQITVDASGNAIFGKKYDANRGITITDLQLRTSEEFTGTGSMDTVLSQCILSQNTPNPFTANTEINYYVSAEVKQASVSIFDMQGKLLETYPAQTGQGSVVIEGAKLQAGMYLYSLIADGEIVDTKRMLLTK